jgi:hypothetical protein
VVFAALGVGLALRRPRKLKAAPARPALVPAPAPEPIAAEPEPEPEPEPDPEPEPAFDWPASRPAAETPAWTVAPPAEWIPGASRRVEPEPEPEPEPVAEVDPVEEPVAAEPEPVEEPVAAASEPRPDQRELLAAIAAAQWTCELTWSANLRSAGFHAKATAPGERAREAARSGKLNYPPLVPPAAEQDLILPARAVAKALVGAGWTPTTRGDHWYSQRFAWTHDGTPPELGAIEVPQATVRNLRRGRPSRRERTTA